MSAFSCQPGKGSEPGVGWNWSIQAAKSAEVYVLTRTKMKPYIEATELPKDIANNIHFVYCDSSLKLRKLTIYLEYIHWQYVAYCYAKKLCKELTFDYVWHITWGNMFLPTWMYKLPAAFIWGPIGGAEQVPKEFWNEFPKKNRLIHQCKYYMGKGMRWIPWVIKPATHAKTIVARTTATKELFPRETQEKIVVHLESCVVEERDFFYPEDTKTVLKRGDGKNLIYTGRICDIKNIPTLVQTMTTVKEKFPGTRLHIIGDGDMVPLVKRLIQEKRLEDSIILYGNIAREELLKAVSQADAFVFPSLREGASWSLLEAMNFELPIVAFDANGMHDTLSKDCAILIPLREKEPKEATEAFTRGVMALMSMPSEESKLMGKLAHRRLCEVHSAEGVRKFIESIVDNEIIGQ